MRLHGPHRRQAGFSLIELSIVLVIIGLLLGGGIAAFTAATEQTRRSEAKRQLQHVREALYGFTMANGRLPCPDDDSDGNRDGREDHDGTACDAPGGGLPWAELGLGRRDPWGAPLYYRVDVNSPDFADPDPNVNSDNPAFELSDDANLSIDDGEGNTVDAPAVVVSFGPQGSRVWSETGYTCPIADFSAHENENCDDSDNDFVAADYRTADADDGRFDDVVIWLPLPVLKSRMVDAGLLP